LHSLISAAGSLRGASANDTTMKIPMKPEEIGGEGERNVRSIILDPSRSSRWGEGSGRGRARHSVVWVVGIKKGVFFHRLFSLFGI